MLIGGAEDKLKGKRILSRFVRSAGGADADIVVVSTASELGPLTNERYRQIFGDLGVERITGVHPQERAQAEDPDVAASLVKRPACSSPAGISFA